ncbi:MAG: R3H domain-containing nucleic acid-binding protein [bacterium]|nr:R3H domain-containing nucleic acid-binding protein [bacterium]
MDLLKQKIEEVLVASGIDFSVEADNETQRINIFIQDQELVEKFLPSLVKDLEHIVKLIAKNLKIDKVNIDVNNYKREREHIIVELAKAAARKVLLEKKEIILPPMNSYERRIVHVELATRPDVKTESIGEGSERHIVVKLF